MLRNVTVWIWQPKWVATVNPLSTIGLCTQALHTFFEPHLLTYIYVLRASTTCSMTYKYVIRGEWVKWVSSSYPILLVSSCQLINKMSASSCWNAGKGTRPRLSSILLYSEATVPTNRHKLLLDVSARLFVVRVIRSSASHRIRWLESLPPARTKWRLVHSSANLSSSWQLLWQQRNHTLSGMLLAMYPGTGSLQM